MVDPKQDGIDHINIWTKARTPLGKQLSNLAYKDFTHPRYGYFNTMEGFWHWLATGKQHEIFRSVSGFKAKTESKNYNKVNNPDFEKEICEALTCRFNEHRDMLFNFVDSHLPFKHYFVYGDRVQDQTEKYQWMIDYYHEYREYLQSI